MGKRIQKVSLNNLQSKTLDLGYMGEHEHTRIEIDCTEVLWDYPNATASMVVQPPTGDMYPLTPTREDDTIVWLVTDSDVANHGTGSVQITFTNDGEIVKSAIGSTRVRQSIVATGEAPDPIQTWIDQAEETAAEIAAEAAAGVVDDLEEAKDAAIEAIEAKGEETIESIPEDYTNLSNQVTDLKTAKAPCVYSTASGSVASFPDGADGMPLKSLSVQVDPVQDLHGYDSPWPAGGGKNKFKNYGVSGTEGDVVFTVRDDGTVNANGTASGSVVFTVSKKDSSSPGGAYCRLSDIGIEADKTYILNGCPGGSLSTYILQLLVYGSGSEPYDIGSGSAQFSFTADDIANKWYRLAIRIFNGTQVSNLVFKPMIRLASETDTTYAPYSNICPISGHESATVTRTGKNLASFSDGNKSSDQRCTATYVSNGVVATSTGAYGRAGYSIPIQSGQTYTLSMKAKYTNGIQGVYLNDAIDWGYSYGTINLSTTLETKTKTFTATSDILFVGFYAGMEGNVITAEDIQLEVGPTESAYQAYTVQSVTIPLGQTVYGGTLDVTEGKLTIDRAIVDLGTLNWTRAQLGSSGNYFFFTGVGHLDKKPKYLGKALCTALKAVSYNAGAAWGYSNNTIVISNSPASPVAYARDDSYTDPAVFKTAMDQVMLCYELAEPVEVTLTAQEMTTLLGVNNVFSDSGDVSVEYPADTKLYIDRKITEAIANALNA